MKNEKIYDGITGIRESIVERADAYRFKSIKRMTWRKWTAIAACVCLAAGGIYGAVRFGMFSGVKDSAPGDSAGGGGGNTGAAYMSYAGPVFTLTTLDSAEGLTAKRNINFDFSPYESFDAESIVTDGYTLSNTTGEDVTVTAAYPFAGSFSDAAKEMPEITVNGMQIDTELFAGPFTGGYRDVTGETTGERWNPDNFSSWEQYNALLSDSQYMARAFDAWPELNGPVIVYEISDRAVRADADAGVADLKLSFEMDGDKTTILTYGFSAGWNDSDSGKYARGTGVPESFNPDYGESAYLIVLGDDIENCALQGWSNGWKRENDAVTGTLTRYETTLDEILRDVMRLYIDGINETRLSDEGPFLWNSITEDMYFGAVSELLCDFGKLSDDTAERYGEGMLEDMFSETLTMRRVMYLAFELTIPAGGSVDVTAEMVKKASIDFIGENKNRNGYDMVTLLGSDLTFTAQTASISNTEHIEIIDQNFGFDLANGVTEAKLDMSVEHYRIDIRRKK